MSEDTITKEEMINELLEEFERNYNALKTDDPRDYLERRQRFLKARLETFGVNTENLEK